MPRSTFFPAAALTGALLLTGAAACGTDAGSAGTSNETRTAGSADYPVEIDNCGVSVTIEQPIEKAIAVNQPAVELLLALGLGDRMAGYAISDDSVLPHLEEERAKVEPFDAEFPSLESVLDREPDFVYTTFDYTFTSEGVADREQFTKFGVPTYQSPSECSGQDAEQDRALTLQDQYDEITDIATLFGVAEAGEQLVTDLERRATAAKPAEGAEEVTLAWWYAATKTPFMAGCCGAPGLMTRAVGATNAFEDSTQYWPETGWESILDRDPTVLVLADLGRGGDGDSAEDKIAFLESDPVASRLTAVREKRYIILDGTTMDPSIRNVDGIETLSEGLRKLGLAE